MKKFELYLQGGVKIIINQAEKAVIIAAEKKLKDLGKKDCVIEFGENRFKHSMIKAIFEIKDEVSDNKDSWIKSNQEWHDLCLMMSKRSVIAKTEVELKNRIMPGLKLGGINLSEQTMAVMEANIRNFFEVNMNYPRCPMRIWWPFIADVVAPMSKNNKRPNVNLFFGKWWEIVSRNDGAIQEWVKFNG